MAQAPLPVVNNKTIKVMQSKTFDEENIIIYHLHECHNKRQTYDSRLQLYKIHILPSRKGQRQYAPCSQRLLNFLPGWHLQYDPSPIRLDCEHPKSHGLLMYIHCGREQIECEFRIGRFQSHHIITIPLSNNSQVMTHVQSPFAIPAAKSSDDNKVEAGEGCIVGTTTGGDGCSSSFFSPST